MANINYTVTCGDDYLVSIDRACCLPNDTKVCIDDHDYEVKIEDTFSDGKIKSLIVNNKSYAVQVHKKNDGTPGMVELNGKLYYLHVERQITHKQRKSSSKEKLGAKIICELPGKVIEILVKQGDVLRKGQRLIVLESMKMKNMITTHRSGKVKRIHVEEGHNLLKGCLMIEIE